MGKPALVVDSTLYLPEEYFKKNNIKVVSLNIIDQDKTHKETELDNEFVFSRLNERLKLTTSQPSPSEFLSAYEACLKEGYERILVVTLSKELSGTYQSATLAKNMMEKPDVVHVFDTQNAAYGTELVGMELVKLVESGMDTDDIIKTMEKDIIPHTTLLFTVENLFFMQRGGRLSRTQAFLGTVLRVKPIIKIIEGKLKLYHKERTHKKVYDFFLKEIMEDPNRSEDKTLHIRLIHRISEDSMIAMEKMFNEHFPNAILTKTDYLGPVFSIHVGPKGFGICWFFK